MYNQILEEAESLFDYTRRLRRDIHMHPEIGFEEVRTARIIEGELNKLGLEIRGGVGKTGSLGNY